MAKKKTKRRGRPTKKSATLTSKILGRISGGESLKSICKLNSMPSRTTFFRWLHDDKDLRDMYARAKEECADALADDIVAIVDEEVGNPLVVDGVAIMDEDRKPVMVKDKPSVDHARLRVDARKWVAAKLKPRKYGDKYINKHVTDDGKGGDAPISQQIDLTKLSDSALAEIKKQLENNS